MPRPLTIWLDEKKSLGVAELTDPVFGTSFHPIECTSYSKKEYVIIANLWYTTYTGARHYFRAHTNRYHPDGRMKKVCTTLCNVVKRGEFVENN
ncbi:hypothetical protein HM131_14280 [Halobacillus mangrovi]|uniref:Uncharacterized protein n=1 Tax=Halobacillus mangrovi TaxID=402384 RepID=A0A1W5ZXF4_9BACI|nr:hypothetical protein HM131_14280 [Halobacillus mangrovi]